jgi:hypothetical protein
MRARIRDRFADLHQQRTQAETRLTALTAVTPRAADPAILDELPYCEDILDGLPPALKARLFAAIDLNVLWNKTGNQVTVYATITDQTLAALTDLLNPGQDGYHDTAAPAPDSNNAVWALPQPPIAVSLPHHAGVSSAVRAHARPRGRQCGRPPATMAANRRSTSGIRSAWVNTSGRRCATASNAILAASSGVIASG